MAGRIFAAVAMAAALCAGSSALAQKSNKTEVDLELVLAVDISRSMDESEHALQRDGYVQAFRHKDVIQALLAGPHGRIAVTYMEWAASSYDIIPWTIIDSEKASLAFAQKMADEPINGERSTSISTAILDGAALILNNDIQAPRRVIDVSGDGANNSGGPVEEARDAAVKEGIIINGLPILLEGPNGGNNGFGRPGQGFDIPHLDRYYRGCVIGGPGAFIAPVFSLQQLAATIRKKLVMEIAGRDVEPGAAPIQYGQIESMKQPGEAGIELAQLKVPGDKPDCMAGEKMRMNRGYGGFGPN